ncbi:hypothetical protein [Moheibacter stercoris]|uniref:Uncharacterized protein n=1 Tax=Moheibacter stercoris TaxID=1628251 RepID=A0ABV2LSN7_9FLAO
MKLKLFTLYLLFFGSILSAQEILKTNKTIDTSVLSNDLMDKMAEETCECVKKLDFSGMPQNQIEMNLGMCILQSISSNKIEVENQLGAFSITSIMTEEFGEKMGLQMLSFCSDFFINNFADEYMNEQYFSELSVELGKIKSIEKKQFNTVNLQMYDGSILKFIWLWDFEGSEILTKNQFKNKWINIIYSTIELYDPEIKKYIPYRVIEGMSFGE